jgi:hypothetical protein
LNTTQAEKEVKKVVEPPLKALAEAIVVRPKPNRHQRRWIGGIEARRIRKLHHLVYLLMERKARPTMHYLPRPQRMKTQKQIMKAALRNIGFIMPDKEGVLPVRPQIALPQPSSRGLRMQELKALFRLQKGAGR